MGQLISGVPIVGSLALAPSSGLPGVLGFDEPQRRKAVARNLDVRWTTVIHPKAFLDPSASVGAGSVVLEGVVAQADVDVRRQCGRFGQRHEFHHSVVEDFVPLWTGWSCQGTVHIGEGACLETRALVIPNMHVGAWTLVGPRRIVIRDVPENAHVEGLPARPVAGVWPLASRQIQILRAP